MKFTCFPNLGPGCARVAAVACVALLAACSSGHPPEKALALAQSAVDDATHNGAAERAPQELISAREKLARAQEATKAERYQEARRMAEEAEADARLASAKSRTAEADAALTEFRKGNTTLMEELQRQQPGL